jgi:hypothetical protein
LEDYIFLSLTFFTGNMQHTSLFIHATDFSILRTHFMLSFVAEGNKEEDKRQKKVSDKRSNHDSTHSRSNLKNVAQQGNNAIFGVITE